MPPAGSRDPGGSGCTRGRRPARASAGPETAVPAALQAGGPRGLACLRQCQRDVEDLQPRHRRHRQLHRRGGRNEIEPRPALQLDEAELSLQAVVDPYARADFFLAASPEGLEVEEGFLTFPTLPGGLLMKVGKLKAQFGKVNTLHTHAMPWVDRPLVVKNLLGGDEGLNDSGISVSKLIPNPAVPGSDRRGLPGTNELFTSHKRGDLSYVGRLRGYRDVTEGTNLDVGTSIAYGHNAVGEDFTTRVIGVDATVATGRCAARSTGDSSAAPS